MANWIWYPGEYEIYHSMCQNFEREERGFFWPAYWFVEDCYRSVRFSREYNELTETEFKVYAYGSGHIKITWTEENGKKIDKKYCIGESIKCTGKDILIEVIVAAKEGLPCIFIQGEQISSDKTWYADYYTGEKKPVGYNDLYTQPNHNPMVFPYQSELCRPKITELVQGGILYDFGREITAETIVRFDKEIETIVLCYGESSEEALDTEWCYLKHVFKRNNNDDRFGKYETSNTYRTKLRAFRYIFIPDRLDNIGLSVEADYKYVNFPERGRFESDDKQLNKIWDTADITFRLSSGIFFIDGIKRDRWIWSGDAYQSYFINQYLFFDKDICKRTIVALRGKDPIRQHINTIVDYSFYWIISIENYYMMSGDKEFIEMIYPKMESMMRYCMQQLNENGFIYGRPHDWVYIDWADMDREGILCAEQMLLARSYQAVIIIRKLLGLDTAEFEDLYRQLKQNIITFFWDQEKEAFVDSYISEKKNITRHANIFAVLFDYVSDEYKEKILHNVLLNEQIPAITTPYFKFYELEALAKLNRLDIVLETIKEYWGGMLEKGASTFWEEYKPDQEGKEQYAMYGDNFGKSLCHAWGASPIYLLGRYFMGVRPLTAAYKTFEAAPNLQLLKQFQCKLPINDGYIDIKYKDEKLTVITDRDGGVLKISEEEYILEKNKEYIIEVRNRNLT